jgi:anti-anti-sigma factor
MVHSSEVGAYGLAAKDRWSAWASRQRSHASSLRADLGTGTMSARADASNRLVEMTPDFGITARVEEARHTIALTGELDMASVPALQATIEQTCAEGAGEIVLDLAELRFLDSAGLRLILVAQETCEAHGCRLRLIRGRASVQRVFEVSGLLDHLTFVDPE